MDGNFDLLGDPIPENWGKRGRPPHNPTTENRNKVRMLLAFDRDDGYIAKALRITKTTLRKHYFAELKQRDEARPALEAAALAAAVEGAKAGSASHLKVLMRMLENHDLVKLSEHEPQQRSPRSDKLGKKEAATLAANAPDEADTTPMGQLLARRAGQSVQ